MKEIELTRGYVTLVDDEDYEKFSSHKWHYTTVGYAATDIGGRKNKKKILLHRLITGAGENDIVDHISGNKLDNRRCNLRITDKKGNQRNQGLRVDNSSGYKGVYWDKSSQKWKAQITVDHKRISLGYHPTKEDAAKAYNDAASKLHGEFAFINVIEGEMLNDKTTN